MLYSMLYSLSTPSRVMLYSMLYSCFFGYIPFFFGYIPVLYSRPTPSWVTYIADFCLYTVVYSEKGCDIPEKGCDLALRRCDMAKEVYSLISIYHKPESGGFGRGGSHGLEAPAPPVSLSLGLGWTVTSRMQRLDWLQGRL